MIDSLDNCSHALAALISEATD